MCYYMLLVASQHILNEFVSFSTFCVTFFKNLETNLAIIVIAGNKAKKNVSEVIFSFRKRRLCNALTPFK